MLDRGSTRNPIHHRQTANHNRMFFVIGQEKKTGGFGLENQGCIWSFLWLQAEMKKSRGITIFASKTAIGRH